ncbi:MAG: hypothetical protein EAZ92_11155 [Candidatus Kapaibacterium sp.]|nr:MAG: hypothetical protein EAZ92_11155 [Candidatus Kapabacteria bacterium]
MNNSERTRNTALFLLFLATFFMNTPEPASSQTLRFLREHQRYFALAEELQKVYAEKKLLKFIAFSPASVFIELHLPFEALAANNLFVKIHINKTDKKADVFAFDKKREAEIKTQFEGIDSTMSGVGYSDWFRRIEHESVVNALAKADNIAKLGANCAPGDNYELGYYGKIQVSEGLIFVRQENHYNAKSLKGTEFSMRDFSVEIELPHAPKQRGLRVHLPSTILHKNMRIYFLDSSSERYKECGDRMNAAIQNLVGRK